MTTKTRADETPDAAASEPETPPVSTYEGIEQWEFVNRTPTREEVVDLLATLPPVWGVKTVDYADYVQGLPSTKKVKIKQERDGRTIKVDEYVDIVTIYMSVSGRVKMLEAAAEQNNWVVDFEPEPVTPTGIPGFLQNDQRIVYREYVVIDRFVESDQGTTVRRLGRKPGTAWVPSTGGSQAAGSNPYEKVETSARGRALAAWGFGVLPGSGIASLEEMQGIGGNRAGIEAEGQTAGQAQPPARKSRGDLTQELLTVAEQVRQARGQDDDEIKTKLAQYAQTAFGVDIVAEKNEGGMVTKVDLSKLRDGQVQLAVNAMKDSLKRIVAEQAVV
jgi:hypothetical protein